MRLPNVKILLCWPSRMQIYGFVQTRTFLEQFVRMGVPAQFSNLGVPAQFSNLGVPAQFSNLGVPAQFSNLGVPAQFVRIGVPAQFSNLGVPGHFSNLGVPVQFVRMGVPAQFSIWGYQDIFQFLWLRNIPTNCSHNSRMKTWINATIQMSIPKIEERICPRERIRSYVPTYM